ncbi:MAG: ribosome maturation factor RimM [Thiohalocapsa sp.]
MVSPELDSGLPECDHTDRLVVLGRVGGLYGVRGWVRVISETDPLENILTYSPWLMSGKAHEVAEGRRHGKGLVVRFAGCDDRDQAAGLVGREISVRRDQLPPARPDEFYWADLEGLDVETLEGVSLGRVSHLFDTGANDVLVVRGDRERLLPFVWGDIVRDVDLESGKIKVDWDPEF